MTDIDPKALEHACQCAGRSVHHFDRMALDLPLRASIVAHARAIEQHEAFKREVSDAVEAFMPGTKHQETYLNYAQHFARFIIAKPDPLAEVIADYKRTKGGGEYATNKDMAAALRAALAARGLKIVEVGHD